MRVAVVSCPGREPIVSIWKTCQNNFWQSCPFPIDVISLEEDRGWMSNLLHYLGQINDEFVLLMLDDHFVDPVQDGDITDNVNTALALMESNPDIAMIKVQAGNAACPEIVFEPWDRIREYDRAHHPFKRTNLVPTIFRRSWLRRLTSAILEAYGPSGDIGRDGAINFEVGGTRLTEDSTAWPERMFGIYRPNPDGGGGRSILACICNDGVREGKLQIGDVTIDMLKKFGIDVKALPGIEKFL